MPPIGDRLKKLGIVPPTTKKRTEPVWRGPEKDGITFSLLSRFLVCRERFRLLVVEGLTSGEGFSHRLEFGNYWHLCEEAYAEGRAWAPSIAAYARQLADRYRTAGEQIEHWYNVCNVQFPLYVSYWKEHREKTNRQPLLSEQVFSVPYKLPSGRVVLLRGKWDSVDLVGGCATCNSMGRLKPKGWGDRKYKDPDYRDVVKKWLICPSCKGKPSPVLVYLQENKTKGDIVEQQLKRQLTFDAQTMLYLVALDAYKNDTAPFTDDSTRKIIAAPIAGVRYNVIRRPLSGGRHNIRMHAATAKKPAETKQEFYKRLGELIASEPDYFFMRWTCDIQPSEVEKFRQRCLDPILEQLCDWWEWVSTTKDPFVGADDGSTNHLHFQFPYGIYNPLGDGTPTELDEFLATGSEVGLSRTENLFPELAEK